MSLIKHAQSQTMMRVYSVLEQFHQYIHGINVPNYGIVFCQGSYKSFVWTLVTFTEQDEPGENSVEAFPNQTKYILRTIRLSDLKSVWHNNHRRSGSVTCDLFNSENVVCESKTSTNSYGLQLVCEPTPLNKTVCDAKIFNVEPRNLNNPYCYQEWLAETALFADNRSRHVYRLVIEDWITALKTFMDRRCDKVAVRPHATLENVFTLKAVFGEQIIRPKSLEYNVMCTPTSTTQTFNKEERMDRVVTVYTCDLYEAVIKQGHKLSQTSQNLRLVWYPEPVTWMEPPADFVLTRSYDFTTQMSVVFADVSQ